MSEARRLPVYCAMPLHGRTVVCEPLLGPVDLSPWLKDVSEVIAGGESGISARPCHYEWVLDVRRHCAENSTAFTFRQTGYRFVKDGRVFLVPRRVQSRQARKAAIDLI